MRDSRRSLPAGRRRFGGDVFPPVRARESKARSGPPFRMRPPIRPFFETVTRMLPESLPHPDKLRALASVLSPDATPAVAFSGGLDSSFLAWFIRTFRGRRPLCLLAVSPLLSRREYARALKTAQELDLPLELVELPLLDSPPIRENSTDRCYHCKKEILSRLGEKARQAGCTRLLDGTHAGDRGFRPGRRALKELGILSPLEEAELDKPAMRDILAAAGLSFWNRPPQSCLATRIPYGTPLSAPLLGQIEGAEDLLWRLGCRQVRVRREGQGVRIEVEEGDFALFADPGNRREILSRFGDLGFLRVSLDLNPYRSGCRDEGFSPEAPVEKEPRAPAGGLPVEARKLPVKGQE